MTRAAVLGGLGVCWEDEQLYRCLLGHPGVTRAELDALDELTGWQASRIGRHLRSLTDLGLVVSTDERPARFHPAVPEAAVEVLALQQQAEIEQARIGAAILSQEFRAAQQSSVPFGVVRGREAVAQRFQQAQQAARTDVLVLDRVPDRGQLEVQRELLKRGVGYRTIYDADSLATAEQLDVARELSELGEQSRMYRGVPLMLVITDRETGLLQTGEETVELGPSELLQGLLVLFELLWRKATPLWQHEQTDQLSADDSELLALAATGLTDQAIARRLGVAQRTVERRMQRIMRTLDATTRFQAGLRAAHRGIIGDGS